ncbi:MAG: hypothetical protein ACTSQA_00655 [Candidatus Heimdallarchaeaceae archaeon]
MKKKLYYTKDKDGECALWQTKPVKNVAAGCWDFPEDVDNDNFMIAKLWLEKLLPPVSWSDSEPVILLH